MQEQSRARGVTIRLTRVIKRVCYNIERLRLTRRRTRHAKRGRSRPPPLLSRRSRADSGELLPPLISLIDIDESAVEALATTTGRQAGTREPQFPLARASQLQTSERDDYRRENGDR